MLTPLGTAAVLDLPPVAIKDEVVALDAVLGPEADRLGERLEAYADWDARSVVTGRSLHSRVSAARALVSPEIGWALRRLDATGGRPPIGELQRELGCSRRHLSARFAANVGVTPKRYAQLVRFGDAATCLRAGASPGEVAARCGYADQAHLTREVRRFGATTPGALAGGA